MYANIQKGFTLIELMIVVALLAIIGAVALPSFGQMINSNRLQAETNEIESFLRYARSQALVSRHSYTVKVDSGHWKVVRGINKTGTVEREYRFSEYIELSKEFKENIVFNANGTSTAKTLFLCPVNTASQSNKIYQIEISNSGMIEVDSITSSDTNQSAKCV